MAESILMALISIAGIAVLIGSLLAFKWGINSEYDWRCLNCGKVEEVKLFYNDLDSYCTDCGTFSMKKVKKDAPYAEKPYGEYSSTIEEMRKESEDLDVRIRETEEVKRLEEEIARKKARLAEIEGDDDDGIVPGSLTVVSTVGSNSEEGTHTPDKTRLAFEDLIAKVDSDLKRFDTRNTHRKPTERF